MDQTALDALPAIVRQMFLAPETFDDPKQMKALINAPKPDDWQDKPLLGDPDGFTWESNIKYIRDLIVDRDWSMVQIAFDELENFTAAFNRLSEEDRTRFTHGLVRWATA